MKKSLFWLSCIMYIIFFSLSLGSRPMPQVLQSSSIIGTAFFEGHPPIPKVIQMSKEPFCAVAQKKMRQREETVSVNPDRTLRNVVVFIKQGLKARRFRPPGPVVLDQYNCWYRPHVLGVMTGQTINVINSDPRVLHNLHFLSKVNSPLNFGEPGEQSGGNIPSRPVIFRHPEMIPLQCDVHPWMHAVVAVLNSPYFSVTLKDGSFSITDLPPGKYVLKAWHEKLGSQTISVTLEPREKKVVNFVFRSRDPQ